jgi:RNA recognition motif-containing protein
MGGKLFVGNLGLKATSLDLERLFASAGTVKWADIAKDPKTGRPRGFGFVEMGSGEEARRAVIAMNGRAHQGKFLKVSESKPKGKAAAAAAAAKPERPKSSLAPRRGFRVSGR